MRKTRSTSDPAQDLADLYYRMIGVGVGLVVGKVPNQTIKREHAAYLSTKELCGQLLQDGWDVSEIHQWIVDRYRMGIREALMCCAMPIAARKRQLDLQLDLLTEHDHHPALLCPTAPRISIQNGGETTNEPSIGRVTVFTVGDLIERYESKVSGPLSTDRRKAFAGMLAWSIREQSSTLEDLLNAIDVAEQTQDKTFSHLPSWVDQGREEAGEWRKARSS